MEVEPGSVWAGLGWGSCPTSLLDSIIEAAAENNSTNMEVKHRGYKDLVAAAKDKPEVLAKLTYGMRGLRPGGRVNGGVHHRTVSKKKTPKPCTATNLTAMLGN